MTRPLRLVLHAGLHKSGTTTVQQALRAAYGTPRNGVWFPLMDDPGFGHELIVWTMRGSLQETIEGLAATQVSGVRPVHLHTFITQAVERGVEVLVISAEGFDQSTPEVAAVLRSEIGAVPTTLVLTVTRPVHRWFSVWQEWVKHGAATRPLDSPTLFAASSLTAPGALRRQLELLPHDEVVIRLVRPSPPEPDLAGDLLAACGITPVADLAAARPTNQGLGVDIELLRRLNALGITVGIGAHERFSRFETFRAAVRREPGGRPPRAEYGLPAWFTAAAREEADFLRELAGRPGVTVLDPQGQLDQWTDISIPEWVVEMAGSLWPEVPDADPPPSAIET